MKSEILKLLHESKNSTAFFCALKKRQYLIDEINRFCKKLKSNEYALRTKVYWYLNDLTDFPRCTVCGKKLEHKNVLNINIGYNKTCSKECTYKDKNRNNKIQSTLLSRTAEQKEYALQKSKATCLKKYGVEFSFQSENNKNKSLQTLKEHYGNDINSNMDATEVIEKIKQTNLERYGTENVFASQAIRDKIQKTNLSKYGVSHHMKSSLVKERLSKSLAITKRTKSFENNIMRCAFDKPCFSKDYYLKNYSSDVLFEFECNKCGKHFFSRHVEGFHSKCPSCYPRTSSAKERELQAFIQQTYSGKIVCNDKKTIYPYELDVFIPQLKLAFEFDGLYWHAFENKSKTKNDKNYHLNKTTLCEAKGIQLIHVFEDEWNNKNEIVKSRIKNLFGQYDKTVYARNCMIKETCNTEAEQFLEAYHIQGHVNSSVKIGLYHDEELVSLMTFGKCRFDQKHEWELLRLCSKNGYHVPGAAGKMLKYFEKNYCPTSLVSYADRRWSQGKVYDVLGFKLDHISQPNYWYMPPSHLIRYNRTSYQKHLLKEKLESFDESLSEYQNMLNNGFETIYDCGNLVYVKTY